MRDNKHVLTRRDFLRGTIGATIGTSILSLPWPKGEALALSSSIVTGVRDKNAIETSKNVDNTILEKMLEQTLIKFTGEKNIKDAWLSLVKPGDMIGLVPTEHLNPTHDELVDAVQMLLSDSELLMKLGLNARKTVERRFGLKHHTEQLLNIYLDLIDQISKK